MNMEDILQNLISKFNLILQEKTEKVVIFRSVFSHEAEINEFIDYYCKVTDSSYIVYNEVQNPQRLVFHKIWMCRYSSYRKSKSSKKNFNCSALIDIKIKKYNLYTVRRDEFLKHSPPLPCVIKLMYEHTHILTRYRISNPAVTQQKRRVDGESINSKMARPNSQIEDQMAACPDINEFLLDYVYDVELKMESSPPNSSEVLSEVPSSDNEVSVFPVPKTSSNCETALATDTHLHIPCSTPDSLAEYPSSCSLDPVIVSVSSLAGMTYSLPQNIQTVINPNKYSTNIQSTVETNTNVSQPVPIQTISSELGNKSALTFGTMEKLSKGALQLRVPKASPVPDNVQTAPYNLVVKTEPGENNPILSNLEIPTATLRKQNRLLKNRESAFLSRKRKKEYVQKLEAEVKQIISENSSLREENQQLKLKVSNLEEEVLKLKSALPSNMKKTTCLMVVFFMMTFNLAPFSLIFDRTHPADVKSEFTHRKGRVLLWDDSNSIEKKNETKSMYQKLTHVSDEDEISHIVDFNNSNTSCSCQRFLNKTELLRLESDLLSWAERVKKNKPTRFKKQKFHMDSILLRIVTLSKKRRRNKDDILKYETPRKIYEDFFDGIHRRDDTFYFVSICGDHLLFPAVANNKTLRPRMSFIMPAMTPNESVNESDGHISMMQVDCEVMNTKLINIKESLIPKDSCQKANNAVKTNSKQIYSL